jgi:hypothetical protein
MDQLTLVIYLAHDAGRPPASLKDLEGKMEADGPLAKALKAGAIVVNWGSPVNAPWWAYERESPVEGGLMILPDDKGEMKPRAVTADEAKRILGK